MTKPKELWVNISKPTATMSAVTFNQDLVYKAQARPDQPATGWVKYVLVEEDKK